MSAQLPNFSETTQAEQPKNEANPNYVAPSIEKTNRLAEVTGTPGLTGPV